MTVAPMFRTDNANPAPMFGADGKPLLCDTGEACCEGVSTCDLSVRSGGQCNKLAPLEITANWGFAADPQDPPFVLQNNITTFLPTNAFLINTGSGCVWVFESIISVPFPEVHIVDLLKGTLSEGLPECGTGGAAPDWLVAPAAVIDIGFTATLSLNTNGRLNFKTAISLDPNQVLTLTDAGNFCGGLGPGSPVSDSTNNSFSTITEVSPWSGCSASAAEPGAASGQLRPKWSGGIQQCGVDSVPATCVFQSTFGGFGPFAVEPFHITNVIASF